MSKYSCRGCACYCQAVIDNACDVKPTACIYADIKKNYDPDWNLNVEKGKKIYGCASCKDVGCELCCPESIIPIGAEKRNNLPFEECKECIEVSKAIGRKVKEKGERRSDCNGTGLVSEYDKCQRCHGTGKTERCPDCNGTGEMWKDSGYHPHRPCLLCKGTGKLSADDNEVFKRAEQMG